MWSYLGKRTLQMLVTLLLFQAATYFLLDAQPGDIADLLTSNPKIPPSQREVLRHELGLDRPFQQRLVAYIENFYRGDLGVSFDQYPRPVMDIIVERLPRTLVLFLTANILAFWTGFVSGKILAWRRGGFIEYTSTIVGVTLYTVFTPWFALMMIWLFSVYLGWLPPGKFLDPVKWISAPAGITANKVFIGMIWAASAVVVIAFIGFIISNYLPPKTRPSVRLGSFLVPAAFVLYNWWTSPAGPYAWDILSHLILPVLTVTLIAYGGTMLLTRTSMLETLREDYILTARAKGLPEKVIRDKHAARNALLPVWTSLIFALGASMSGGIITESIFSWPGIGLTLLNSALIGDIPLAMGALTMVGIITLLSHLVVDVGYAFLDPRIRF